MRAAPIRWVRGIGAGAWLMGDAKGWLGGWRAGDGVGGRRRRPGTVAHGAEELDGGALGAPVVVPEEVQEDGQHLPHPVVCGEGGPPTRGYGWWVHDSVVDLSK